MFHKLIHSLMHSRKKKIAVIVLTFALLVSSIGILFSNLVKKEAMPMSDDIYQFATVKLTKGVIKEDLEQVSEDINAYLMDSQYVKKILYYYGDAFIHYTIELTDKRERDLHSETIINRFNRYVSEMPDVHGRFSNTGEDGASSPISIMLMGSDRDKLAQAGRNVVEALKGIEGAVHPKIDFQYSRPTFDMVIDQNKCDMFDVDPMSVMLKLRYLTSGEEIVTLGGTDDSATVYLKYHAEIESAKALEGLTVLNSSGQKIALAELVHINETRFNSSLEHYEGKPSINVVADKETSANTNIIMGKLLDKIDGQGLLPEGVTYKLGSGSEDMAKSFKDLGQKMLIASVLVYIVLVLQFNSYMQPFAIVLSIPYAIIGVVLGYVVFGLTFSTLSFLGIVALVGIAVNDAIVLIDYINMLREKENMGQIQSIVEGAKSRLGPILATSMTTISGVLPLAIYNEDYSGIAYSLIFGLIFSTVLTLVVVPVTLNGIESIIQKFSKGVKAHV